MSYRTAYHLFNTAVAFVVVAWAAPGLWWIVSAANSPSHVLTVRAIIVLLPAALVAVLVHYWPTRRRPDRLYHLTRRTAAEAATTATLPDGSVTVQLRSTRFLTRRSSYFFPHPPRRRLVVLYNLRHEPDVAVELHTIDYTDVQIRRRVTGAYRLRGLLEAGATIRPYRWNDR